jgi:hypothetical protein
MSAYGGKADIRTASDCRPRARLGAATFQFLIAGALRRGFAFPTEDLHFAKSTVQFMGIYEQL